VCQWYGVRCSSDGSTVYSLKLGANNLSGATPPDLFDLPGLTELWLYSNPIKFNFIGIERANNLTTLLLDDTGLVSLDGLRLGTSLVHLDLGFNMINGIFPYDEINSLVNLKTLSLAYNNLTGELVPFAFDQLVDLEMIRLDNNMLSGSLPSFSSFPKLVSLDLSNNFFGSFVDYDEEYFGGSIPSSFLSNNANKDLMVEVNVAGNQLTGTLPQELGDRFDHLTIDISGNYIVGIPTSLCKKDSWMEGEVTFYGCDAIACPEGTYAEPLGRATRYLGDCQFCPTLILSSRYIGNTACPA
jgi:Leucine-rich repeat (LRR) protein